MRLPRFAALEIGDELAAQWGMRWWWVALVAGCGGCAPAPTVIACGANTMAAGDTCTPIAGPTCGTGTHEMSGACVADTGTPAFEVRVEPTIRADGFTNVAVRVFGTNGDGSPNRDPVVLSIDRATAGAIVSPAIILDELGGASNFVPCNGFTSSCIGPAKISVALASAPTVLLAHADIELAAPPAIGDPSPCAGSENILYFDGNYIFSGPTTFSTGASFSASGADDRGMVQMGIGNVNWEVGFDTHQLGIPLLPTVFEHAVDSPLARAGQPGFWFQGSTAGPACTPDSSFQILAFDHIANPDEITLLTATFAITCTNAPTKRLTGCVHYTQ